jgi:hypothetical protein
MQCCNETRHETKSNITHLPLHMTAKEGHNARRNHDARSMCDRPRRSPSCRYGPPRAVGALGLSKVPLLPDPTGATNCTDTQRGPPAAGTNPPGPPTATPPKPTGQMGGPNPTIARSQPPIHIPMEKGAAAVMDSRQVLHLGTPGAASEGSPPAHPGNPGGRKGHHHMHNNKGHVDINMPRSRDQVLTGMLRARMSIA